MPNPKSTSSNLLLRSLAVSAAALATAGLLAGCGGALSGAGSSGSGSGTALIHYGGNVHGGQQPVVGATVQFYTVGTSGLKSASSTLGAAVTTDGNGNFAFPSVPDCTSATQVYLVAKGGYPIVGQPANNALSLMSAVGPCTSLSSSTFIQVNELTTVAAVYALAPFMQDYTHIGATGSNPTGLTNAFASAISLVSTSAGQMPGPTLPAGAVEPVTELNTIADIIAACVNTDGSAGATPCGALFAATGATETIGGALGIAKYPGSPAITALYTQPNAQSPFQPTQGNTQPNDYTVAITYSAAGTLAAPYAVALDATGNAWVANEGGSTVTELSSTGSVLTTASPAGLFGPQGVAVDRTGNVWIANTAGNSVIKLGLTAGAVSSTNAYTSGITAPAAIALDSAGNAFVANFNSNSVAKLNPSGGLIGNFTGNGGITVPSSLALDTAGNVLVPSGSGAVIKLGNNGSYLSTLTDNALQGPMGIALDPSNRAFVTGSTTGSTLSGAVSEFDASGNPAAISPLSGVISVPLGAASDGSSVWIANGATSGSLAQLQYGNATPLSPAAGFGSLSSPVGVAVDASGNIWVANSGNNTVSKFIGLAAPVTTPLAASVGP